MQPPQEGSDDGGDVPRTLDIWRSPGPTCPGTNIPFGESLTSKKDIGHFRLTGVTAQQACPSVRAAVSGTGVLLAISYSSNMLTETPKIKVTW